jgi:hypothetical protein
MGSSPKITVRRAGKTKTRNHHREFDDGERTNDNRAAVHKISGCFSILISKLI